MGIQTNSAHHTVQTFNYHRFRDQKETILEFLLRRFRYFDEAEWTKNIEEGRILINDAKVTIDYILLNQQVVTYLRPDFLEPKIDPFFEVLYEDEFLIGVNKSGNMPTSPSGKYYKHTLLHQIKKKFGWEHLYTLHRLDRETSGVILFAKQQFVAQEMGKLIRVRKMQKTYLAILTKKLPFRSGVINQPIGRDLNSSIRIKQAVTAEGKPSKTHFQEIKKVGDYVKCRITPTTGRTHQIRVHASYLGSPIVGDKLYGLPDDGFLQWLERGEDYLKEQQFPLHRQLLHAESLAFIHPITKEEISITANENLLMQHIHDSATFSESTY